MDKDLRNRISENKILTRDERTKIISDLESYEKLQTNIKKAIEGIQTFNGYEKGIDTMNVGDDIMISWCKTLDILENIGK